MNQPLTRQHLIVQTVLGLGAFVALFIIVGFVFRSQLLTVSHAFAQFLGGASVPLGFFAVSAFLLPAPDDLFAAFGLLGGMDFWTVVGLAVLGSVTGGAVAYHLGARLKHTAVYGRLLQHHHAVAEQIIARYGVLGVAIVALTPLPDSPMCWICGGLGLPFRTFFPLYVLGRSLRVTYALWLVDIALRRTGL